MYSHDDTMRRRFHNRAAAKQCDGVDKVIHVFLGTCLKMLPSANVCGINIHGLWTFLFVGYLVFDVPPFIATLLITYGLLCHLC